MVKLNGEIAENAAGKMLRDFLLESGFDVGRIAVEIDGLIVPKKSWESTPIADECSIEVVSFVGGG